MKKKLIIFFIISIQINCYSQIEFSNLFILDTIITIENQKTYSNVRRQVIQNKYQEKILISLESDKDINFIDTLKFIQFNTKSNNFKDVNCTNFNEAVNDLQWNKISSFCFNDTAIFIIFYKSLLVFYKPKEGDTYIYDRTIKLKHPSIHCICTDNNTIITSYDTPKSIKICALNLKNDKSKVIISPVLTYPPLVAIGPTRFINFNENHIIFSDMSENITYIYNHNGVLTQKIFNNNKDWIKLPNNHFLKVNKTVSLADLFDDTTVYSKVFYTYFTSSNEFILNYNINYHKNWNSQIEVWSFDSTLHKYKQIHSNIKCPVLNNIADDRLYNNSNFPISFTSSYNSFLSFTDSIMTVLVYDAPINPIGLTHEEYMKQRDEYLLMSNPTLQMYLYKRK